MFIIYHFFGKLDAICTRLNILAKPMQILNVDETGISVVHKPGKIVTELGRHTVWALTSSEKGENHTVVTVVCLPVYRGIIAYFRIWGF